MFTPDSKFEYQVRIKKDLVTTVGANPTPYMLKFLNELGDDGELVLTLQESGEPSAIAATSGGNIPYYVLTVLTVKVKDEGQQIAEEREA